MRSKNILIVGTILLLVLCLHNPGSTETATSPELVAQMRSPIPRRDYIITIQGDLSDNGVLITSLSPREVRAGRGDPVTWINESPVDVKMKFGKGTECKSVPLKALGWRMEPDKCYETEDTLKPRFTATIRFNEIGNFNYEIEYIDKNRHERGVVRVQTENR